VRVPLALPRLRSVTVIVSRRWSPKITPSGCLSAHIILEPQQGSSIFMLQIPLLIYERRNNKTAKTIQNIRRNQDTAGTFLAI
jgi:hypothetical protein